jgi:AcrR family transcriptional regulator
MTRLTKEGWLDHALALLAAEGHPALTALGLSRALGVSRGSFYWHFDSLDAFSTALVAHWAARTTDPLILAVAQQTDPARALNLLLRQALRSGAGLERAMRAWATVNRQVAELVEQVDQRRIGVAVDLLAQLGLAQDLALARGRLLYWAAIGRLMMPFPDRNLLTETEIADLAKLMECRT